MRKSVLVFLVVILLINLVNAINLEVSPEPVFDSYIIELGDPAIYNITIRNLDEASNFEIYSLVGVDLSPDSIYLERGESRKIQLEISPLPHLHSKREFFNFAYRIEDGKGEVEKEQLTINILNLADAFTVSAENINPKSDNTIISIKNRVDRPFEDLKIKATSAFFEQEKTISLDARETKEVEIEIEKDKIKSLSAGQYLVTIQLESRGEKASKEIMINFLEQGDIQSTESREGIIVRREEIVKKNVGNVRKSVRVETQRDLFSSIFTFHNIDPTSTKTEGFQKTYVWEKELVPNEELRVVVKTNWLFPIVVIILIIVLIVLVRKIRVTHLALTKKVSFVKTKGGEFALKVSLKARAKKFVEKISIIDKLPPLVKLYERFGAIEPDKIDLKNRRLEWNLESLNAGEERIFSYIIYSKIGVVGRFELPSAKATYERDGKIKHTTSNRSFYINEPKGVNL
jgi:hypothetical protein